jgi:BCCT family betaine/carnitine transporter
MFFSLLIIILLIGGRAGYIIETGFESLGRMVQNFISLATYTDPLRENNFPQDWTIYYWAYWMTWCVAAPFFIGNISRGRTVKQVILGGFLFGLSSTIISFIILGGYGMGVSLTDGAQILEMFEYDHDMYNLIINIIDTLPLSNFIMVFILLTMILFYATSFDSIAYTASCYSYKTLNEKEKPSKIIELIWCIMLIILPIALVFSDSSMQNIQSVSIICAFPIGIIILLIILSFFKDAKKYIEESTIEEIKDKDILKNIN